MYISGHLLNDVYALVLLATSARARRCWPQQWSRADSVRGEVIKVLLCVGAAQASYGAQGPNNAALLPVRSYHRAAATAASFHSRKRLGLWSQSLGVSCHLEAPTSFKVRRRSTASSASACLTHCLQPHLLALWPTLCCLSSGRHIKAHSNPRPGV